MGDHWERHEAMERASDEADGLRAQLAATKAELVTAVDLLSRVAARTGLLGEVSFELDDEIEAFLAKRG